MKTRGKTIVPRNPYAVAASQRKAGAHEKTHKVKRRDARQALRRDLGDLMKGGDGKNGRGGGLGGGLGGHSDHHSPSF